MATMTTQITIKDNKDKQKELLSKIGTIRRNAIMKVMPRAISKA